MLWAYTHRWGGLCTTLLCGSWSREWEVGIQKSSLHGNQENIRFLCLSYLDPKQIRSGKKLWIRPDPDSQHTACVVTKDHSGKSFESTGQRADSPPPRAIEDSLTYARESKIKPSSIIILRSGLGVKLTVENHRRLNLSRFLRNEARTSLAATFIWFPTLFLTRYKRPFLLLNFLQNFKASVPDSVVGGGG